MADIDKAPTPALPRELTSISDAVRAVGAPPTPVLDEPYAIRLINPDADAATVSQWMNRPHVAEAWAYDWSVSRWRRYLAAQLDGEYSRPFIGSFHGTDICYLELYRSAKDCIASRYAADPHDIGVHAAIADAEFVNRGVASTLLPRLVANLFEIEPRCRRITFDPDHSNAVARRVCEIAGAVFLGEHEMSNRRMALYVLARSPL